jgi:hypothetical protein
MVLALAELSLNHSPSYPFIYNILYVSLASVLLVRRRVCAKCSRVISRRPLSLQQFVGSFALGSLGFAEDIFVADRVWQGAGGGSRSQEALRKLLASLRLVMEIKRPTPTIA